VADTFKHQACFDQLGRLCAVDVQLVIRRYDSIEHRVSRGLDYTSWKSVAGDLLVRSVIDFDAALLGAGAQVLDDYTHFFAKDISRWQ
jgi:hypothetical protein